MTLATGTRLGPYEIVVPLGAGGMGEVYRARDSRLGREVAIKVLPAEVASDPERLRRFEQEAKAVSALNHPHIVTLHEIGSSEVGPYLVLEKIDGQSLRELLRGGALPVKRVLTLGAQIAEGLAKAHSAGIVHRDLKPENVMVTADGFAKILDFGLAKLVYPELEGSAIGDATTLAEKTGTGMILGTIGYLSPEQAVGKPADFRSDQFALGALLYELASGERPFRKETVLESLAAVIREAPEPLRTRNAALPVQLGWIVERCLAKDPSDRYASTKDLARDLADLGDHLSELSRAPNLDGAEGAAARAPGSRLRIARREGWAWSLALLFALAFGSAIWWARSRPVSGSSPVRASLLAPEGNDFDFSEGSATLSPEGGRIAFLARDAGGTRRIWLRALASLSAQPLERTEGATHPFWAPDGKALGFFQNGQLRRLELASGEARALCDVEATARGGAWSPDGTILFTPSGRAPIFRVPAAGGKPVPVTELDQKTKEFTHRFPSLLPGAKQFLYLLGRENAGSHTANVFVSSVDGRDRRALLFADSSAIYSSSGHLLFVRGDTLYAQRFDVDRLELDGEAIQIAERVQRSIRNEPALSAARNGALLYQSGLGRHEQLAWMDRQGRLLAPVGPPGRIGGLELSHDGKHAALVVWDERADARDIWVRDLERDTAIRLSFDPGHEFSPIWSPDDRRILYSRDLDDRAEIVSKASDGSGAEEIVVPAALPHYLMPQSLAPDGRTLAIADAVDDYSVALVRLPGGVQQAFGKPAFEERNAQIAPDGRWIAYESDESGRTEVYIEALGGEGRRLQISNAGGTHPRWRRDARELFYLSEDLHLVAVSLDPSPALAAGEPRVLFEPKVPDFIDYTYDVAPDGERFLFLRTVRDQGEPPLTLVTNWAAELPPP